MNASTKIAVSGVKPSGELHLGNYLGAIKQFVKLQDDYKTYFFIADLHAITEPQDPDLLTQQTLEVAAVYLAAGLNPTETTLFVQSHVPAHIELGWILNTITPMGELYRMTQFRDKTKSSYTEIWKEKGFKLLNDNTDEASKNLRDALIEQDTRRMNALAGLFNYPTLMAADILLYQPDVVPVGEDQLQHLELTRTLARKFNARFGKTFKEPKALLRKEGARIKGLDDPTKKMAKSASSKNNYIALLDSENEIRRKIKIAVTDSGKKICYNPDEKPAISNLLVIFSSLDGRSTSELELSYRGKNYTEFKDGLADAIIKELRPIQKRYYEFAKNPETILAILRDGARQARAVAARAMQEVKEKVGLVSAQ